MRGGSCLLFPAKIIIKMPGREREHFICNSKGAGSSVLYTVFEFALFKLVFHNTYNNDNVMFIVCSLNSF